MDDSDRLHPWMHRHNDDLILPSVLRYLALRFLGTFVFSEGNPVGSTMRSYRCHALGYVSWRLTVDLKPSLG